MATKDWKKHPMRKNAWVPKKLNEKGTIIIGKQPFGQKGWWIRISGKYIHLKTKQQALNKAKAYMRKH